MKLIDILVENPDTLSYQKKYYNYTSPANRSAFFVYKDKKTGRDELFGYSDEKKEFYSSVPDVLKEIDELKNKVSDKDYDSDDDDQRSLYWAKNATERLGQSNNGGGHLSLENILKGLQRGDDDPIIKGRIFKVDDGKIVVTFWEWKKDRITKYKKYIDQAIEFNGYKPTECLYEHGSSIVPYDKFYSSEKPEIKPNLDIDLGTPKPAAEPIKVGDIVSLTGMGELRAQVVSTEFIGRKVYASLKITKSDRENMPVGETFNWPVELLTKVKEEGEDIQKMYDDKMDAFVTKSGELHTKGARITPQEKENLQREVDTLELETKKLKMFIDSGIMVLTPERKQELLTFVNTELAKKHAEKKDRYSLIKQAEKQYGMPIAQIRQKYRGVPLDKLVKKEHLIREIIKRYVTNRK